jgi:uncharacterized membrane protein YoaK (UPF0700 family)
MPIAAILRAIVMERLPHLERTSRDSVVTFFTVSWMGWYMRLSSHSMAKGVGTPTVMMLSAIERPTVSFSQVS